MDISDEDKASVAVRVSNDSAVTRRAQQAEFAVGGRIEFIRLPSVPAGGTSEVVVEVPTERRGVIPLGPVIPILASLISFGILFGATGQQLSAGAAALVAGAILFAIARRDIRSSS